MRWRDPAPQLFRDLRVRKDMAAIALERDTELMLRVKGGDAASFATLLAHQRGPVIHFLYRMVANQSVAEELAQEVFLRVYRARTSYEPAAKFTTWLFRIATHVALNHLRDRKNERGLESLDAEVGEARTRQIADTRPNMEQTLLRRVQRDRIRGAIQALPGKQRAAVLMHKYQEMEYSQIAGALACSESAVKSLLFRAYENLRARLADCI
jgi:RNA polymerase sigma-70 factor (ECF subfamily)